MNNRRSLLTSAFTIVALLSVCAIHTRAATFTNGYTIGSGLLGPVIVDAANHAGLSTTDIRANDTGNGAGAYTWLAVWGDLWDVGDTVSISGIAIPVRSPGLPGDTSNNTDNGTFTFTFYELSGGTNVNEWEGTDNGETVLATATADFVEAGTGPQIIPYVTFDSNITFSATSPGIAVHMDSTSSIRTRRDNAPEDIDGLQANRFTGVFLDSAGDFAGHQWTLAGTAVTPPTPLDRVWLGNLSAVWDTSTFNWTNGLLGSVLYTNGTRALLDDTLDSGASNTNITLNATHTPESLTVNNTAYDYSLSGGKLSGGMGLTKTGFGALTLNMANDYSGGSTLEGGVIRLGNANGLGTGTIDLNGGALSSSDGTARTATNAITINGAATLGDAVNTGTLTLSGPADYAGAAQDIDCPSDVILTGTTTNGGLDVKTGDGTLTYAGVTGEQGNFSQWQIEGGDLVVSGGSITKSSGGIRIGNTSSNGVSRVVITNGAHVLMTGSGQNVRVGNTQGGTADPTSTNILDVAATLEWPSSSGGVIRMGDAGAFAQVNLYPGGLLKINRFTPGANASEVNFLGGTLGATADQTDFLTGLNAVNINTSAGAIIDTDGHNVTIGQFLSDPLTAGGGVIKKGAGTLVLSSGGGYTGATIAEAGTVEIGAGHPFSSAVIISNSAAVGVDMISPSFVPSLELNGSTVKVAYGDLSGFVSGSTAITDSGALVINDVNTVELSGINFGVGGPYTIISYSSKSGAGSFSATPVLPAGVEGTVSDTGSAIVVTITKAAQTRTWYGYDATSGFVATNVWDTTTTLWDGGSSLYQDYGTFGDNVVFDDTVYFDGTDNTNINITTAVQPVTIVINNNTVEYSFNTTTSGKITGSTAITKQGTNTATLNTANDYTGATTVEAGVLRVANAAGLGGIGGATTVENNARLELSGGIAVAGETANISGHGGDFRGALRSGSGTSTWAGPVNLVSSGNQPRFGAESNAVLEVTGTISDGGTGDSLWIRCSDSSGRVILSGSGNSYGPTRVVIGSLQLGFDNVLPTTNVLQMGAATDSATLDLAGFDQTVAGISSVDSNPQTITNSGGTASVLTIDLADNNNYQRAIVDGASAIAVVKDGAGRQTLSGTSSYTGTTTVNGGSLRVLGTLGNTAVSVNSGATLDGTGTINGTVAVNANGTLSPGTSIGALTISNSLTLGGDVLIELDKGASPSNDVVVVTGTLGYGGTLTITNIGATPLASGDSFTLFTGFSGQSGTVAVVGDAGAGNAFSFDEASGVLTVVSGTGPTLDYTVSGGAITFTWDDTGGPFTLEAQTNELSVGLTTNTTNWFPYPNGTNGVSVPINAIDPTVFFRLTD